MQPEDVKRIVTHWHTLLLDNQHVNTELIRVCMIAIEACRPLLSPECYAAALVTVQAAANSADASGDKILRSLQEVQRL
jgi:hypothetical protein